jgi:hypothetical protein
MALQLASANNIHSRGAVRCRASSLRRHGLPPSNNETFSSSSCNLRTAKPLLELLASLSARRPGGAVCQPSTQGIKVVTLKRLDQGLSVAPSINIVHRAQNILLRGPCEKCKTSLALLSQAFKKIKRAKSVKLLVAQSSKFPLPVSPRRDLLTPCS